MEVEAIILEISKFLHGRNLLNFKLTCKGIEKYTRKMSCKVIVRNENYKEALLLPGIHVLDIVKGSNWWIKGSYDTSKVVDLIIDFKNCPLNTHEEYDILDYIRIFKALKRLKIVNAHIPINYYQDIRIEATSGIEYLEIYNHRHWINLYIHKEMKQLKFSGIRLYQ